MKKILLLTNIPAPYTVDLIYYMQKHLQQYDIHVIYTSKNEDNREWSINDKKMINSIVLKSKIFKIHGKLDNRYIHIPGNIAPVLNGINPDAVIAWEYNLAAIQSLIWCKKHDKRYISLTEGTINSEKNLWLIQKISRKVIAKHSDAFLVSGIKAREKLISWKVPEEKIFTELLTVDTSVFKSDVYSSQSNKNIILYVGSMVKRKGVDLLISALPYIKQDYQLRIVGNGSEDEIRILKKLAQELKIADKIEWCGFKTGRELVSEYENATVFVLPTREDCFGLVLLEALSAGIPIVASKYADGAYDIINDINGCLVNPYNSVEIAESIEKVLCYSKSKRMEVWNESKNILSKFSFDSVAQGYEQALEYALEKK